MVNTLREKRAILEEGKKKFYIKKFKMASNLNENEKKEKKRIRQKLTDTNEISPDQLNN